MARFAAFAFSPPRGRTRRAAFTLVELMVSIGIIAVLLAITLPALHAVREQGRGVVCTNHLHQLWQGFTLFAADHDGRLPGNANDYANPDPDTHDWLAASGKRWTVDALNTAPQQGTLFRYVNRDYRVYRCPSLEAGPAPWYEGGGMGGSNGRWDYVAFRAFSGCCLSRVPTTARFVYNNATQIVPTPILCEEDASTINGSNMEGNHSSGDQMGHQHRGGGYYASPDGTVNWFAEPLDACALNWWVTTSRGATFCMGGDYPSGTFEHY